MKFKDAVKKKGKYCAYIQWGFVNGEPKYSCVMPEEEIDWILKMRDRERSEFEKFCE